MGRRSWPRIFIDILEACRTPLNKMRIMYKSNLNPGRFDTYFSDLLRKGFIERTDDANRRAMYIITERGRTLLEVLLKAQDLVSSNED
jgi:predicted transcriptional regulator